MTEREFLVVTGLQRIRAAEDLLRQAYIPSLIPEAREAWERVMGEIAEWKARLETEAEKATDASD